MAAVCVLLANKDFKDGNPHKIPNGSVLEEWLDENFLIVGPMTDDDAQALTEQVTDADPDRYWAILPMNNGKSFKELL